MVRVIAIDLGKVRTGLAISDKNEFLASPIGVIEERNRDELIKKILLIIDEYETEEIVIGLPKNMNGTEGDSAINAREFANKLSNYVNIPIIMRDERVTTVSAHNYLNTTNTRGKKRKYIVDSVAAVIILQDYLDFKRNKIN